MLSRLTAALASGLLAAHAAAAGATTTERTAPPPTVLSEGACASWVDPGLEEGPLGIGYYSGDFATGRRACPRSEIGIGGRGGAIIDTPNFYGNVVADGLLFGSWAVNSRTELFATLEAVHLDYAVNATLSGSSVALGQLTAGVAHVALASGPLTVTPSARLLLPTSLESPNVHTGGAELGVAANLRPWSRFDLHGYLGGDFTMGFSTAPAAPRFGALALLGAQYSPLDWLSVVIDVDLHLGENAAVRGGAIDYVAPSAGLRVRIWRGLGAELAATLPLAGSDRHDGLAALKITYRL